MEHVFPVTALLGDALIGLSVVLFALLSGRLPFPPERTGGRILIHYLRALATP